MSQINLRLSEELKKEAEKYAHRHGYKNIQEFAKEAIRTKVFEKESIKETLEIMKDKSLIKSIKRSREDVRKGRVISWKELQKRWEKQHGKK